MGYSDSMNVIWTHTNAHSTIAPKLSLDKGGVKQIKYYATSYPKSKFLGRVDKLFF